MNVSRGLLLVITFVLAAASFSSASAIYLAQNAAGAGDGSNCANPRALAGTTWTAGNAYHLCGTITSQVAPNANGTTGSPIAILFEPAAKISMSNCSATGCINIGNRSFIVVDGGTNGIVESTNTGTGLSSSTSYGVYARTCTSCEIKNLTIRNMYVHNGASDDNGQNSYGIWLQGSNNLVHNNIIHDGMSGITVETNSSGNKFYNNTIYNVNWGIFESAGASANAITNEKIYNNEFYDFANWDTTADTFHHDGIFLSGNNATDNLTNVDVYNNYIHGTSSSSMTCAPSPGNGSCMTAYIYINTDSNVRVFNNLLVANANDAGPNNGWILMYSDANDSLYNNTVIGGTVSGHSNCVVLNTGTNYNFKNNVLSNCSTLLWSTSSSSFATLDSNTYQNSSLANAWRIGSNFYDTLTAWRTASGGDTSAQATTGSLGLNATTYVPGAGSMVISTATNLTSLGITALDSDKASVARPGGSTAWAAGAYQPGNASSPLAPPTGLAAQVQ